MLLDLPDSQFSTQWRALADTERSAIGRPGFDRYRKLTDYVEKSIERARDKAVISGDEIDWNRWLKPADKARIIAAETLADEGKKRLLMGRESEPGLTLPWSRCDGKVLIRPRKLALWTGWSRHGKSRMLKQIMLHAIRQGEKALVCSMEDEITEVWDDMAIMACGNDEPMPKVIDEFVEFVSGNLWLYDQQGMVDSQRIQALIRYAAAELGVTQVVIDSLMMLAVNRDDYEAQSRFVGELKTTAKDSGATVHLVAHLRKRDGKSGDETPGTLHDIAGGHEIGSKADYVFNVWRDIARKDDTKPACILGVEKQRGRVDWIGRVGLDYHQTSRQFVTGYQAMRFWND